MEFKNHYLNKIIDVHPLKIFFSSLSTLQVRFGAAFTKAEPLKPIIQVVTYLH